MTSTKFELQSASENAKNKSVPSLPKILAQYGLKTNKPTQYQRKEFGSHC